MFNLRASFSKQQIPEVTMMNHSMPMNMMSGMMGMQPMMPMMPNMMGMQPAMPMPINMMSGMMGMPMMPMMNVMMAKIKCTMTAAGMNCEMLPMDEASKAMFMEYCKRMTSMMSEGQSMMINCGGIMICSR